MGKKPRRKYNRDFKLDAVKLVVEQGRGVWEVADGLGISDSLLHRWKAKFLEEGEVAFPGHGKLNPHEDELRRLRKELKEAQMERDILKKATAYFAKETR